MVHFRRQAELGEADLAFYSLGRLAQERVDGAGDKNTAIEHFKRAAALGHLDSVLRLADLLEEMGRLKEANQELSQYYQGFGNLEVRARQTILIWTHGSEAAKQGAVDVLKDIAAQGCQRAIDFITAHGIH
jgi:TPR repeat protein